MDDEQRVGNDEEYEDVSRGFPHLNDALYQQHGNPLVVYAFYFFKEPRTLNTSSAWGFFTALCILLRILEIGLETCDGPNQYTGRDNHARFDFLFNETQYWYLYIACMTPLLVDNACKTVVLIYISIGDENKHLFNELKEDTFSIFMFACDYLGMLPFIFYLTYLRPNNIVLSTLLNVLFTLVELLSTVRVLRLTKNIPSIWAIRIALSKATPHLVVPLFFFMTFNISCAVCFYFLEPCYNLSTCPWCDLFDTSFYSIVTMTTSKRESTVNNITF